MKYNCNDHKLSLVCVNCVKALQEREQKLLEFVKNQAKLHEDYNKICALSEAGYSIAPITDARNLLKQIGVL